MTERKHSVRCECAHPKSRCRCACRGALHGIARVNAETGVRERIITIAMGGDIDKELTPLLGEEYECVCGKMVEIGNMKGYPHEGGLKDGEGKKWWVYHLCPHCEYEMSFWKIARRLKGVRKG